MKRLYSALFALLALSMFAGMEAGRCGKGRCNKPCRKVECKATCAPKTECTEEKTIVMEPCEKVVRVKGVCPHEICVRTCRTTTESKRCTGPCEVNCPSAVNPEDRGGSSSMEYSSEEME